jgi:prepilin-type N-terminal cleavage/methylation domain-containing protein
MMSTLSTENRRAQAGFTLVELAIVLVIVGLLIGGILKGQELIAATRVNSTVSQIKAIDASTYTFNDTFGGKPGDLVNAGTKINGCSANNSCVPGVSGQGDGTISDGSSSANMGAAFTSVEANKTEAEAFFVQLGKAELIGGINSSSTAPVMNDTVLGTTLGSGSHFRVAHSGTADVTVPIIGGTTDNSSQYLLLSSSSLTGTVGGTYLGISSKAASSLDIKMDDGKPGTGSVRGMSDNATTSCLSADSTTADYKATTSINCGVVVKIMQ